MSKGQWYPGNMSRAINQLRQDLKANDLVIELLDARIPASSRNPAFDELFEGRKHLILLHKADRAEEEITKLWLDYYQKTGLKAIAFSVQKKRYIDNLLRYLKQQEQNMLSGRLKRPLRMIFVGIPNVGKSTLINLFVHKAVTKTGNRPGITRGRQWIRIMPGMELLDTPGILRPKNTEDAARALAAVGAIPAGQIDRQDIALWLIEQYLEKDKFNLLFQRYNDLCPGEAGRIFEQIGISQGCLRAESKIDAERTAALLLRDFQGGALGRITLESPPQ